MTWATLLPQFGFIALVLAVGCAVGKYVCKWGWQRSWITILAIEIVLAIIRPSGMKVGTLEHWVVLIVFTLLTLGYWIVSLRRRRPRTGPRRLPGDA